MKKTIVLIVILIEALLGSIVYGQVITIEIVDTKKLIFDKREDYISFLNDPANAIIGGIDISKECIYVFDIQNERWNFFKNGVEHGFVPTNSITEKNGIYTVTFKDNGLPPHQNEIVTQIFTLDTRKNSFISAYFDDTNPYVKVSLPKKCVFSVN